MIEKFVVLSLTIPYLNVSSPLDILVEDNQILEVGNECDLLGTNHKNYILV